jgi:protease I
MKRVAVMATDGIEQSEFEKPIKALKKEGILVDVISLKEGKIKGWEETKWGDKFKVNVIINNAHSTDHDMLVLPGGVMNTDTLRTNESAVRFVSDFFEQGKPIAAICRAGSILIETGLLKGKMSRVTTFHCYIKLAYFCAGLSYLQQPGNASYDLSVALTLSVS